MNIFYIDIDQQNGFISKIHYICLVSNGLIFLFDKMMINSLKLTARWVFLADKCAVHYRLNGQLTRKGKYTLSAEYYYPAAVGVCILLYKYRASLST